MTTAIGVRCACGHNQARHELAGFDGECIAEGCRCTEYRPVQPRAVQQPGTRSVVPPAPRPETVEQLVEAARATKDKRALLVIGRMQSMASELRAIVAAHHARARDAAYKAQLDTLPKLKLPRDPNAPKSSHGGGAPVIEGGVDCEVCGKNFPTRQGAVLHRRRAHEGYNPVAIGRAEADEARFAPSAAITCDHCTNPATRILTRGPESTALCDDCGRDAHQSEKRVEAS